MSGNNQSTAEFDEFVASGEVEVGVADSDKAPEKADEPAKKPAAKRGPPRAPAPAAKAEAKAAEPDDDDEEKPKKGKAAEPDEDDPEEEGEGEEGAAEEDEDEDEEKPKKKGRQPSDRIRDLTRRLRESERQNAVLSTTLATRLDNLENGGLPNNRGGSKTAPEAVPAPDPTDTDKYPLGHLDDRYIEDKLEWLAEDKAAARADAALHRQQEAEQTRAAEAVQQDLLGKVDDLATRGDELYDDFQESVVEAGMRGDWDLSQATFEAAHEVDNGAQILYELSQDKKEASRVAKLSNYQQMKFVQERDVEIGAGKKSRKIPKAGAPPENTPRGANSKTHINPATDNLDDFEKAWERDAKGSRK